MDGSLRDRERAYLERELDTETGRVLLRKAGRIEPVLAAFGSWWEAVAFMRAGDPMDPRKDAILRAVALSREEDGHPLWSSVLLLFFWPGLLTLFKKKQGWDPDPDELWQEVMRAFLDAVDWLDVRNRPDRIASKLINDTYRRAFQHYAPQWRRLERERPTDPELIEPFTKPVPGLDTTEIDLREAQESGIGRIEEAFKGGAIDKDGFLILVGTCVYGRSVADYAREHGRNYESLKKKRQRDIAAVAAWYRRS